MGFPYVPDEMEWRNADVDTSESPVHVEVGGRGFPQYEPKQRFLLCAKPYDPTWSERAKFGFDSTDRKINIVKLNEAEKATCEECLLLAAVLKANNVEVRSNDARKFKEHLLKVMNAQK